MLTIGVVFVIWNFVIAQSVSWLRAVAIPASVALVVAGSFLATVPFSSVGGLGTARFLAHEVAWLRARWFASAILVVAGVSVFAMVAFRS